MKNMKAAMIECLSHFSAISLQEIGTIGLNNRTESKYVLNQQLIPDLLTQLQHDYFVLEVKNYAIQSYHTRYFDTEAFSLYLDHHNGKSNRFKIRCRLYEQTNDCFLEIKQKVRETQSIKTRIAMSEMVKHIEEAMLPSLLSKQLWIPKLDNAFNRITLCDKNLQQRITIDTNIRWNHENTYVDLSEIAVIEIKQQRLNNNLHIIHLLKENLVPETSFSKYSIGIALLNPTLKQNNFKPILRSINKFMTTSIA